MLSSPWNKGQPMPEVMNRSVQEQTDVPRPSPEGELVFRRWLHNLNDEFTRHTGYDRRSEIVRDELHMLFLGKPHGGRTNTTLVTDLPLNVLMESFDARNAVLTAEMEEDIDRNRFYPIKPLILFWRSFDLSALGLNLWLGCRFRGMLGQHIFASMGRRVRFKRGVTFTFGYNLSIEDDAIIEPNTHLDDRQPLTIPSGTYPSSKR